MIDEGMASGQVAARYDEHAVLESEVAERLLERVEFLRYTPDRILDLGCGTGMATLKLKARYRKAQVIGLDISTAMLGRLRKRSGILRPLRAVCADMSSLPLPDRCADLLFSNMALQWSNDLQATFSEFRRVLRPGGMLLFATPGPDSLKELSGSKPPQPTDGTTRHADNQGFADMHDFGDALLAAGFQEPVTDSEIFSLNYSSLDKLLQELEYTGASTFVAGWSRTPASVEAIRKAYNALGKDGHYPLTYEIVYGTAFGPQEGQPRKTPQGDVATFSVEALRSSRLPGRQRDQE